MIGRAAATALEAERRRVFSGLVDRDLDRAYRLAGVILGNGADAEDATHDAVVQAWRSFGALRDLDRFEAWFQRILVNTCRDRLRKNKRQPVTELRMASAASVTGGYGAVDDRLTLDRAFTRLSPDQAITVVLRFHADLKIEDIAARMAVPVGTVKSRLHAALSALETALGSAEGADR
jgi:RNA polymerase sigma-70 factor (ECF subfamily)